MPRVWEGYEPVTKQKNVTLNSAVKACANCVFFKQYYQESEELEGRFLPVHMGLCTLYHLEKKVLGEACISFTLSTPTAKSVS